MAENEECIRLIEDGFIFLRFAKLKCETIKVNINIHRKMALKLHKIANRIHFGAYHNEKDELRQLLINIREVHNELEPVHNMLNTFSTKEDELLYSLSRAYECIDEYLEKAI